MDPKDERLPGPPRIYQDLKNLPPSVPLPAGLTKTTPGWYVQAYTTRDGRTFYEFYQRGNKPALPDGSFPPDPVVHTVPGAINTEQQEKWEKEQKEAEKPAAAPTTRVINGVPHQVTGKDANGQDIWAPVQTTTGPATSSSAAPQAAAPGGKPYIDDGPEAGATGRRWGWNPETRLYDRDLGPSPSAQQPQTTTIRVPVQGKPGVYLVSTKNPQTGLTDSHYENESGQRIPQPPDAPSYATQQREINGQVYTTIVATPKDGSPPTVTHYGPDGKPAGALPGSVKTEATARTINGQVYTTVTSIDPSGQPTIKSYGPNGQEVTALPVEGRTPLPAGMPELDTSSATAARASYLAQVRWVQSQRQQGALSAKEAVELLNPSKEAAQTVIDAEQTEIANTRQTRTQDIQQEGNRLQASTAQFGNMRQGVDDIIRWAPSGGNEAGNVLLSNMLLQNLMNQTTRGNVGAASPAPAAAGVAPLPSPMTASAGPNALGLGSVPASISALDPGAAQNPDAGRAAEIMANPVFRPDPPVNLGGGVNPAAGDPGNDPTQPVGLDLESLPPAVQQLYGRSIIDQIMQRHGGMA
jgi:hypothetical protein